MMTKPLGSLERGPCAEWLDVALLPSAPGDWTFLIAGDGCDAESNLCATLRALDFRVETADGSDLLSPLTQRDQTILLAETTWLAAQVPRIHPLPTARTGRPLVVGVVDTGDRACLLQACRAGAVLLLDRPLDAGRLLSELAGLAWMPRVPYRVLLIDAASERLERHADLLRAVGCEVFASAEALAALNLLDQCAPEVCILGQEASADDHSDIAVLLRYQSAFTDVPMIHLSRLEADVEPPLAASAAAGCLDMPVMPPAMQHLIQIVLQRARACRRHQGAAKRDADPTATPARPKEPRRDTTEHSRHYRILIAEDNLANQALLRMQVEALGHEVDTANDGPAALAKWKAGGHDLLLTDLNMPGMDGLALTRSIRAAEQEYGGHLPIIAITATEQPETLAACHLSGMDDVLPKPIKLDDLRRRLAPWLSHAIHSGAVAAAASPSSIADATLDTDYIIRLVGDIGQAQMRGLIDLFTATARVELRGCRNPRHASDARHLALTMHKLKSSARMVGALHFAVLAERLEATVDTSPPDMVSVLIAELDNAIGDVETAAQRLVTSPASTLTKTAPTGMLPETLPRCVLVVDDDDIARRQTSLLLDAMGIPEVRTIDNSEGALAEIDRAKSADIDLLITDLNMPGMDGVEFVRGLAKRGYTGDLVISSGVDEPLLRTAADLVRARGLYLRGAVKKPLTRDALARLLMIPRERVVRPPPSASQDLSSQDILDGIRADTFCMHFQPKVDASTLQVMGVEALARWSRDGVPVGPDVFIGTAERHALIAPLSNLLLTKTLLDGARLVAAGFPLTIAFNLSPLWLSDIHLPEFILDLIQLTSFPADRLILEITESSLLADLDTSMDVLTRLRLKGFKLSIDDFGTGYSSMEQLQRIPFSELKLDRSFVHGAAERPAVRAILAASIEMARKLHLTTVAEGVETQADLDLVRGLGCDLVQGWLIAKPMPVEELIVWLQG